MDVVVKAALNISFDNTDVDDFLTELCLSLYISPGNRNA